MTAHILVTYASKTGSTAEIAQAIGKELQLIGFSTEIARMETIASLSGYHAVVIGGPLYMGKVVKDVGKFVGRHRDALASLPVAAFAVGITPVSKDPVQIENAMQMLRSAVAPLHPVSEAVFAGRLDPKALSFIQRKMTEMAKSPVGDFRDWDAIARWAQELPAKWGL